MIICMQDVREYDNSKHNVVLKKRAKPSLISSIIIIIIIIIIDDSACMVLASLIRTDMLTTVMN